ncbi:C6 zinc finger domain-containing protein [Colletotrichum falcatum]|nr:C6 zinc finger domain-containing protein [Colletotrichum falcatum]
MDPGLAADPASTSASSILSPETAPRAVASLEADNGTGTRTVVHRPRHTRTSTPKVRTGCVTCKKRHVKCDEAKPHCMNCLKTRGVCDGYVVKPRKARSRPLGKAERPNAGVVVPGRPAAAAAGSAGGLIREPDVNTVDFATDWQSIYFDDWNELVSASLGGASFSRTRLWTTTMPQLCRRNPALRHAAIGIGAISRALSSSSSSSSPPPPHGSYVVARNFAGVANLLQSPHYQNAVVHYCKALRLQGQADFDTASIQEAVLLSILFVAFEALRGNRHSALQHVKLGFMMLHELLVGDGSEQRVWNLAPDPRQLVGDVLELYNHFDVQSRTVVSGRADPSARSPAYELTRALKARGHTIETYSMQIQRYTDPRDRGGSDMPEAFGDADDAHVWWTACQRRIAKLAPLLLTVVDGLGFGDVKDERDVDRVLEAIQGQPELVAYCEASAANLEQWRRSFEPLYHRTLSDPDGVPRRERLRVLHLRMHYLVTLLYSFFPRFADAAAIASMTPCCREINDVAEALLREQRRDVRSSASASAAASAAHAFSMELGLAWQVTLVAMTCRDPLVRDDSARILEAYPRREGLWDSAAFLAVVRRNRELEADNARAGGSPAEQWRRLCRREFIFEDAGETIVFRSLRRDAATGGWDLVEEAAEFRGEADGLLEWKRRPLSGPGFMMTV